MTCLGSQKGLSRLSLGGLASNGSRGGHPDTSEIRPIKSLYGPDKTGPEHSVLDGITYLPVV